MSELAYRIADEPRPSGLAHLVVNPVWPLLAVMFGGVLLSWPWFLFNAQAVGSPTRRREALWVVGGLAGSVVILLCIIQVGELVGTLGTSYLLVGLTVWKLFVSYWLYILQSRSFHLYEHFGGRVRNGMLVVVLGFFVLEKIYARMPNFLTFILH